ncbi:MAG: hypothetical protein UBAL2_80490287 [Leptospirillum rubarum]|nr:MAG: hypothetical protein UBAL2_80490287 [Leptospirillum rubarum]
MPLLGRMKYISLLSVWTSSVFAMTRPIRLNILWRSRGVTDREIPLEILFMAKSLISKGSRGVTDREIPLE